VKPSDAQLAVMVLAMSEGYIRPSSPTHARRLNVSPARATRTVTQCVRVKWLRGIGDGRYRLTDKGAEHVPSAPRPRFDGETWAEF
jgi:Mn-dependent DtxR family transcriptional regulator